MNNSRNDTAPAYRVCPECCRAVTPNGGLCPQCQQDDDD